MSIKGLDAWITREPDKYESLRGMEWTEFSDNVLYHVEEYTVPQYGDKGEDNVTDWSAKDCVRQIEKYVKRFGKNAREGQDKLDLLKVAHYACLAYNKLEENK